MLIDKSIKTMYNAGHEIIAVMNKNETLWGDITAKISIPVVILTGRFNNHTGIIIVEGKEYERKKADITIYCVSSSESFTFILKTALAKYDISLNSKVILSDEVGSVDGKTYTITLENFKRNRIYIIGKK